MVTGELAMPFGEDMHDPECQLPANYLDSTSGNFFLGRGA